MNGHIAKRLLVTAVVLPSVLLATLQWSVIVSLVAVLTAGAAYEYFTMKHQILLRVITGVVPPVSELPPRLPPTSHFLRWLKITACAIAVLFPLFSSSLYLYLSTCIVGYLFFAFPFYSAFPLWHFTYDYSKRYPPSSSGPLPNVAAYRASLALRVQRLDSPARPDGLLQPKESSGGKSTGETLRHRSSSSHQRGRAAASDDTGSPRGDISADARIAVPILALFMDVVMDILGMFYLTGFSHAIHLMRIQRTPALCFYAVSLVLLSWAADGCAMAAGKAAKRFGRGTPIFPILSPNKTLEGMIAAIICPIFVAWVFRLVWPVGVLSGWIHLFDLPLTRQEFADGLPPISAVIGLGLIAGIGSVVGDLFESVLKRSARVKDSGTAFSSHGAGGIFFVLLALLFCRERQSFSRRISRSTRWFPFNLPPFSPSY